MTVIDFSSSLPSAKSIKNSGHEGAILYCSPNRTSSMKGKQPPKSYIDSLDKFDLKYAFVWQYRGGTNEFKDSDVRRGYSGGIQDAKDAQKYLISIGKSNFPVYFAVDFDITLDQWNSTVVHYFKGVISVLGKQRVGIYGHSRVIAWAQQDNVVATVAPGRVLGWITKSWNSVGKGADYSTLYQRIHNVSGPDGVGIDINDTRHSEWGWRPIPQASKPTVNTKIRPNPNHRGDLLILPELLKLFGVPVKYLDGWDEWGMGDFGEIWGVGVHHTGANSTSADYIARNPGIYNALSSQILFERTPPYYAVMCGIGIAWHMGKGSYPGLPTNNANPKLIGIEAQSNGTDPWPAKMLDIYHRMVAAILWYLGHNASRCISHWEYSLIAQGKWDPGAGDGVSGHLMDMVKFRSRVQYYIDNPPFTQEEVDNLSDALKKKFKSRAPGSDFVGNLEDYIVNGDAHAWVARVNSEKLLAIEEKRLKMDEQRLETDNRLASALETLADLLRK